MWFMLAAAVMQAFSQKKAADTQAQEVEAQGREAMFASQQAMADKRTSEAVGQAEGVEAALEGAAEEGTARVARAASGGRTDVGGNFLLSLQSKAKTEWEIFKTNFQSRARTERFGAEAKAHVRQSFQLLTKAQNIKTAGRTQMFGTILGGLGQSAAMSGGKTPQGGGSSSINVSGSSFRNPQAVFGSPSGR